MVSMIVIIIAIIVVIVCLEMGIPYFKVRQGTRLRRTWGPWEYSHLALGLGNEARERTQEGGISLTLVIDE